MASSDLARAAPPMRDALLDGRLTWAAVASLAIAFPTLVAYNVPPSATFLNQAVAFVGWGAFVLVLGISIPSRPWPRSPGALALTGALGLLFVLALLASVWRSVPWSISLSSAGTIASAILVVAVGAATVRSGYGERAFTAFCIALVVAGCACSAIALIQVFAPGVPDGAWIAPSAIPGRATGNLRQPNHLSSILLWSIVGAVWLGERKVLPRVVAAAMAGVFAWGVLLTASRTGAIGIATLAVWGLLDRRLSRTSRLALLAAPLAYFALWGVTTSILHPGHQTVGADARLSGRGLFESSSRFAIYSNALALVAMHPWLGVGFGEFNFAWTLTPFPTRPNEFFDHAHNLGLQLAVELGVPLALAVLALFAFALWRALRIALADGRAHMPTSRLLSRSASGGAAQTTGSMQRAAFVVVLMAGMHSMLEYPLWYAYFLLPTAFAFGLCLERPVADGPREEPGRVTRPFVLAGMVLMLGGTLALYDYMRVVVIFAPPMGAASLEERIAAGRSSVLFAHHADYAEATIDDRADDSMTVFARAPHYLLDSRLMIAWAIALDAHGETDKARYVAARLREFRSDGAAEFFAPCSAPAAAAAASSAAAGASKRPFQCEAPTRAYGYQDFL